MGLHSDELDTDVAFASRCLGLYYDELILGGA